MKNKHITTLFSVLILAIPYFIILFALDSVYVATLFLFLLHMRSARWQWLSSIALAILCFNFEHNQHIVTESFANLHWLLKALLSCFYTFFSMTTASFYQAHKVAAIKGVEAHDNFKAFIDLHEVTQQQK